MNESAVLKFLDEYITYDTFQLKGFPAYVKIVEVGPRDGLQNEKVRSSLSCATG